MRMPGASFATGVPADIMLAAMSMRSLERCARFDWYGCGEFEKQRMPDMVAAAAPSNQLAGDVRSQFLA